MQSPGLALPQRWLVILYVTCHRTVEATSCNVGQFYNTSSSTCLSCAPGYFQVRTSSHRATSLNFMIAVQCVSPSEFDLVHRLHGRILCCNGRCHCLHWVIVHLAISVPDIASQV